MSTVKQPATHSKQKDPNNSTTTQDSQYSETTSYTQYTKRPKQQYNNTGQWVRRNNQLHTVAYSKILSQVPLRQAEDGQYRPKHIAVHYLSCDTVLSDYTPFSKHTVTVSKPLLLNSFQFFFFFNFYHDLFTAVLTLHLSGIIFNYKTEITVSETSFLIYATFSIYCIMADGLKRIL